VYVHSEIERYDTAGKNVEREQGDQMFPDKIAQQPPDIGQNEARPAICQMEKVTFSVGKKWPKFKTNCPNFK
jgi:hypothetical protein